MDHHTEQRIEFSTRQAIIVHRGKSRFGLEQLHILQSTPIELDVWLQKIQEVAGDLEIIIEAWLTYEEPELGVHHLRLYWRQYERN
jgi:hypothetical protein